MTSSQPPQPPLGGQPPQGQQPPQQPAGYGPPPGQQPPAGYGPPPTPGQNPYGPPPTPGPNPYAQPAGTGGPSVSFDPKRLTMAAYVIAGLTLLYLILSFFTWYDFGNEDFFGVDLNVSGWTDGQVKLAFFLFLLATVWALLPAVTDLKLGFPRSWVTVALAALGFVLTLFVWFDTFSFDFSIWALLGVLTAAAILVFAVLSLLPELRNRPALPGALAGAAQWANQPAPAPGQPGTGANGQQAPPTQPYAAPPQQYAPPPQQYAAPPQQQYAPPPAPPAPGPSSFGPPPGGAPASGEGAGPDRPAGI
jgi:hypothetical protein